MDVMELIDNLDNFIIVNSNTLKYNGDKYKETTDEVYNVYRKIIEKTPELKNLQVKAIRLPKKNTKSIGNCPRSLWIWQPEPKCGICSADFLPLRFSIARKSAMK